MNEAVFPLLGPLVVFAVVLPFSAMVARFLLEALGRFDAALPRDARHAALVASSALPVVWFVSASLHQSETGTSAAVCAVLHDPGAFCPEAAYFSLGLCLLAVAFALPRLFREQLMLRPGTSIAAQTMQARVEQLIRRHRALHPLVGRTLVSEGNDVPLATVGIVRPRVVVEAGFAAALDDEALTGALHHELEHVVGRDPCRYFLAWWALAVNPFGRWLLASQHARWLFEREAQCDRQAVATGAGAAALAHALVTAAKPARPGPFRAALGSGNFASIRLRVGLLLAYADRRPSQYIRRSKPWGWLGALALVVALPHASGTHLLDAVHVASESAVSSLLAD
jgi:beta-lactamase regulating signal transducer with metallopeptidase domain